MKQVTVHRFGGPEVLELEEAQTPSPGPGHVLVRLTSIGMNHADLMGRAGNYKASTGEPPYTPGLEGGGYIEAVGDDVQAFKEGQRVILGPDVPRGVHGPDGGTYRSHLVVNVENVLPAPDADVLPDEQLGTIWLAYLTAWGCLAWKDELPKGSIVGIPAASSSVGLAAAQVVKKLGGKTIGLTSSPGKVEDIQALDHHCFDHLIVTHDRDADGKRELRPWHREIKNLTDGHGVDVFFDPVANGDYLTTETRCLAQGGRIYIYGLLGKPGPVDLSPLIIRQASLHGWVLYQIIQAGEDAWRSACDTILGAFKTGEFKQHIAGQFKLDDVQQSHIEMAKGEHLGKLVLIP